MTTSERGWRRDWTRLVVISLALQLILLVSAAAVPAQAAIKGSDFPRQSEVRVILKGKAPWTRHLATGKPLGAKPAGCRSDLPYAGAAEHRAAFYVGRLAATTKRQGSAEVQVHRFATAAAARDAMARVKRFVTACPTSIEWVCEQCDGIATITRRPAANRKVGKQSYTWTERRLGMGAERARIIASRTGRTLVVTTAAHFTTPEVLTMPPPVTWKRTKALARLASAKAAP